MILGYSPMDPVVVRALHSLAEVGRCESGRKRDALFEAIHALLEGAQAKGCQLLHG